VPQEWARLATYLRAFDLNLGPTPKPRQFAGGFGNLNYLLVINDTRCQ
jgi:hypothetical protein